MWSRRSYNVENFEVGTPSDSAFGFEPSSASVTFETPMMFEPSPAPAPVTFETPMMFEPSPAPGPAPGPAPAPLVYISTTNAPPGVATTTTTTGLTITMLRQLVTKISTEIARITPLASGSPTITAKTNNLIALQATIQSYIDDITRDAISIEDVPIRPSDAQAFLAMDLSATNQVPNLTNSPTASVPMGRAPAPSTTSYTAHSTGDIQSIFAQIQDMKWRMEINYDPTFNQQKEMLDRLENLERRMMSYISTGSPIPSDIRLLLIRELKIIGDIISKSVTNSKQSDRPPLDRAPPTRSGRTPSNPYSADSRADYNQDPYIRPGFIMNDYQIQHRASAAAFNTGVVGGLDYQKRAKDLCRQIRSAGLGDPTDFGCIENQNDVSASYSWRGNFMMVCDRLGDTWGHWYPEMMGCLPNK